LALQKCIVEQTRQTTRSYRASSQDADSSKPLWCWERTLPVSWCAMDGAFVVNLATRCTRPAGRTCCGAAGRCSWWWAKRKRYSHARCKPFCSTLCNCAIVASNDRSASTDWRWPAEDWKCGWIGAYNVAIARALFTFLSGSHESASRTGHSTDGSDPQSLGWESNLTRSTYPGHVGQHSSNLPSATALRFYYSSKADLCSSAQVARSNWLYALNKYLLSFSG
jgi:hypothetical protein